MDRNSIWNLDKAAKALKVYEERGDSMARAAGHLRRSRSYFYKAETRPMGVSEGFLDMLEIYANHLEELEKAMKTLAEFSARNIVFEWHESQEDDED